MHIYKYYPLHHKISKQQMITNQSTNEAAKTYYIDGQAAKQKCFYLNPAGQFLIQGNSRSDGKEVSVLNGARRFINVFARTCHWLISKHTISVTSILILSCHLRLRSSVCVTNVIHIIL
jgi:hypothetical protein